MIYKMATNLIISQLAASNSAQTEESVALYEKSEYQ